MSCHEPRSRNERPARGGRHCVACIGVKPATISNLQDRTTEDARTGAMRSVQAADLSLPEAALRELWSPMNLERLARTYWRVLPPAAPGRLRRRSSPTQPPRLLPRVRRAPVVA